VFLFYEPVVEVYVVPDSYVKLDSEGSKLGVAAWPHRIRDVVQCYKAIDKNPIPHEDFGLWQGKLLKSNCRYKAIKLSLEYLIDKNHIIFRDIFLLI
jgi:hypothetical protein